jgi:hypothetical protein
VRDNWGFGPSDRGAVAGDEAYLPYRRLAVSVLARALQDLSNPAGSATDRESARAFFTGSGMLSHWCRVASLDPLWVAGRVQKLGQVTVPGTPCLTPSQENSHSSRPPVRSVVRPI